MQLSPLLGSVHSNHLGLCIFCTVFSAQGENWAVWVPSPQRGLETPQTVSWDTSLVTFLSGIPIIQYLKTIVSYTVSSYSF